MRFEYKYTCTKDAAINVLFFNTKIDTQQSIDVHTAQAHGLFSFSVVDTGRFKPKRVCV